MNKKSKLSILFLIFALIIAAACVFAIIKNFSNAAALTAQAANAPLFNRMEIEEAASQSRMLGVAMSVVLVFWTMNAFLQITTHMEITESGVNGTFMGATFVLHKKEKSIPFSEIRSVKTGLISVTIISDKGKFKVLAGNKGELAEIIRSNIK